MLPVSTAYMMDQAERQVGKIPVKKKKSFAHSGSSIMTLYYILFYLCALIFSLL